MLGGVTLVVQLEQAGAVVPQPLSQPLAQPLLQLPQLLQPVVQQPVPQLLQGL